MRLDKFLTLAGVGTRSEVKKILKTGTVAVNGVPVKRPEQKIEPEADRITCQGRPLLYEPFVALMFHKPAGCITAVSDRTQKTVMDYIQHERKDELFPVGRLDIDTEGLLLLMNDGELAHRMLSPKHHVEKTYFVRVEGELTREDIDAFDAGIDIGEKKPTLPAKLTILNCTQCGEADQADADKGKGARRTVYRSGVVSEAEVTICEGKFHQIKRMFAARGCRVSYLKRISMAGISLDGTLAPGTWRELTAEEKQRLREGQ
ncbi:MAG: pseudouridine synthase [Lachnospiraceae bacterium]|nr:pseudouridine synthase [Lachnospiraceae bacterium]